MHSSYSIDLERNVILKYTWKLIKIIALSGKGFIQLSPNVQFESKKLFLEKQIRVSIDLFGGNALSLIILIFSSQQIICSVANKSR